MRCGWRLPDLRRAGGVHVSAATRVGVCEDLVEASYHVSNVRGARFGRLLRRLPLTQQQKRGKTTAHVASRRWCGPQERRAAHALVWLSARLIVPEAVLFTPWCGRCPMATAPAVRCSCSPAPPESLSLCGSVARSRTATVPWVGPCFDQRFLAALLLLLRCSPRRG